MTKVVQDSISSVVFHIEPRLHGSFRDFVFAAEAVVSSPPRAWDVPNAHRTRWYLVRDDWKSKVRLDL